ncbi:MAG TPA: hypothetical protein PKI54_13355 [Bacteroidia bacterium]|nr:hypothetical protein [Chitinophagaceae bacterium]HNL05819.1 hypothetical protein [Bacteroidia bacterium]
MKAETYVKQFADYDTAFEWMRMKNKAFARANNKVDILCVVPGYEGDNYAVVDLMTAIELGLGYVWSSSSTGWVSNPWA